MRLEVRDFAHIKHADVEFGDLTALVGPQAAGKSLLLQLWKLALDWDEVVRSLRATGYPLTNRQQLLDAYFGEGMRTAWRRTTRVRINGEPFDPARRLRENQRRRAAKVFFVPAHRALLVSEGWPLPFDRLKADTPAVARLFSQSLYERFTGAEAGDLFPVERTLKRDVRALIDAAVFHGGKVRLQQPGLQKRLELRHGATELPFMTWTAGQREFTPLLLGLYKVLPPRMQRKDPSIDWVIIEEPEMGLHPQAISAVMALVLELLWRGYRVVLSTHAPLILDVIFAMQVLRGSKAGHRRLQQAFGLGDSQNTLGMLKAALAKSTKTYALGFDALGRTSTTDISTLDPGSDEPTVADWGGLTGFSSRFGAAIARAVAEGDA